MKSKITEDNIHTYRKSKQAMYSLIDESKFESDVIPIDPNLLIFKEKALEFEYCRELYLTENYLQFSEEFSRSLQIFSIFFTCLFLFLLIFAILLFSSSDLTRTELLLHIIIIVVLISGYYSIVYLLVHSKKLVLMNKTIFTLFALITNSYLIICDKKVLAGLIGFEYVDSQLPFTLALIIFSLLIRHLLFDCFHHYLIIVLHASLFFLSFNLACSPLNYYSTIAEFVSVSIFLFYNLIESNTNSIRSKIIFWRNYSEEKINENNFKKDKTNGQEFLTESENLILLCDKIRMIIKQAGKVIIFKDIKDMLKEALSDVIIIKKIIGHGPTLVPILIENQIHDVEDREFISQNYRDVTVSSNDFTKSTTFINLLEHKANALFPNYGVTELASVLESIGKNWNFDIWFVQETTGRSITIVGQFLFSKFNLSSRFRIKEDTLERYLNSLEFHYHQNPYHNACHGADVLHSLMYFVLNSDIFKYLNPIETMSCIIAALAHDVGHPGLTNRYLVMTRDPLAIQFNDQSVLENMHCSTIYQFLLKPGNNIFEFIDVDDWICSRKVIIEMILATDMSKHFEILGRFRTRAITLGDIALEKFEDKLLVLSTGLKCADIGHSAKFNDLHQKWTSLVLEEFFKQGDLEKNKKLPVSMYCDRNNTNVPKSQSGFLRNICLPLYEVWVRHLNTQMIEKTLLELKKNIDYWEFSGKNRRSTQPAMLETVIQIMPQDSFAASHDNLKIDD